MAAHEGRKLYRGAKYEVNITPAGTSFPWIHVYRRRYRDGPLEEIGTLDYRRPFAHEQIARALGEMILSDCQITRDFRRNLPA
ncbi:unnamed protein product [marine sediment metagenome]|uniref:Uncharacterized protein n=1 Tax=marine sediment metagenome TaxID=412755 RepID=X0XGC7_9ZZZZ